MPYRASFNLFSKIILLPLSRSSTAPQQMAVGPGAQAVRHEAHDETHGQVLEESPQPNVADAHEEELQPRLRQRIAQPPAAAEHVGRGAEPEQ